MSATGPASAPPPTRPTGPGVPSARAPRSLAPDLARGLMLALIAMANVPWFLWGQATGPVGSHAEPRGVLDTAVQVVMALAVDGRSFPLFAFLFGYGMVQFYRSRRDRGLDHRTVRRMLRRRHWAMLLLGLLHAALLFLGDILGAYAVAGLLLVWIFFGRRDRTLVIWIGVATALFALYSLASIVSGLFLRTQPEILEQMSSSGAGVASSLFRDLAHGNEDYVISAALRAGMWATSIPFTALGFAVPVAIMLGWLAARHRVLDEPWNHLRLLGWVALIGIPLGWIGALPDALTVVGVLEMPEPLFWTFMGSDMITGVATGIGYAAAFGLLAAHLEGRTTATTTTDASAPPQRAVVLKRDLSPQQRAELVAARSYGRPASPATPEVTRQVSGPVRAVAAVGQRSLTFYLFQSLVFAPLLSAWGLGLGQHLSTTASTALALGVWLVSVGIAAWMDARGMRGPAERLLRRMTYGKLDTTVQARTQPIAEAMP